MKMEKIDNLIIFESNEEHIEYHNFNDIPKKED